MVRFKVPKLIEFRDSILEGGASKILKWELREEFWAGHEKRAG